MIVDNTLEIFCVVIIATTSSIGSSKNYNKLLTAPSVAFSIK